MTDKKALMLRLLLQGAATMIAVAILLFLSAGTFAFQGGWVFILIITLCSVSFAIWLFCRHPDQLANRLHEEHDGRQQHLLLCIGIVLFLNIMIAGLDERFSWSYASPWRYLVAGIMLACALMIYHNVFSINPYLSNTVEIHNNHEIVCKGMYRFVRHPMYLSTCITYISCLLILGSWANVPFAFAFALLIAKRIKLEESQLVESLPSYTSYCEEVKYKLFPYVW